MLKTDREKRICDKYSATDANGLVQCDKCPLFKGCYANYDFRCKANSHYDRRERDWVIDDNVYSKSKWY